jgi:hypothetical protein
MGICRFAVTVSAIAVVLCIAPEIGIAQPGKPHPGGGGGGGGGHPAPAPHPQAAAPHPAPGGGGPHPGGGGAPHFAGPQPGGGPHPGGGGPPHPQPVAVSRILPEALLMLLARNPAARIQAVVLLILLARNPAARIQAPVLLMLPARIRVVARIQAAALLISLARSRVRIQAQRHTLRPAAARISLLLVTPPVMVRVMRLSRSAQPMRHKEIPQANARAVPQSTISMRTLRTAISMPTSGAGTLQIV